MKTIALFPLALATLLTLGACSSESTNVSTTNDTVTDLNGFDDNLTAPLDDTAIDNAANASDLGNETVTNG
jgi:hypothetical protein